jgi:hypothetical protein
MPRGPAARLRSLGKTCRNAIFILEASGDSFSAATPGAKCRIRMFLVLEISLATLTEIDATRPFAK